MPKFVILSECITENERNELTPIDATPTSPMSIHNSVFWPVAKKAYPITIEELNIKSSKWSV